MVRTESLGKFLSHQLGSCQGLHINAACGTTAGQRRERKKARGTLNVTIETLRTPAPIYQACLSFDTHLCQPPKLRNPHQMPAKVLPSVELGPRANNPCQEKEWLLPTFGWVERPSPTPQQVPVNLRQSTKTKNERP